MGPIAYRPYLFVSAITPSCRNPSRSALLGKQQQQVTNSINHTDCDFGPTWLLQHIARAQISAARVREYRFIQRGLRRGGELQRKGAGQTSTV
jgi:hypothetical protein